LGEAHADDPVAENVRSFLVDGRYAAGLAHGISATYLLVDEEADPPLLGYATLTVDSVRLTKTEKKQMADVEFGDFGAVRIQMIGVDHRHQCCGHGSALLQEITGLARALSGHIAVRFLIADANVRKIDWYEGAGFVRNQAEKEIARLNPERSVSMRLDLLEELAPDSATSTLAPGVAEAA
jgi:ribosomal protein S18 acetylase RimI-like enzyme